MSGDSHRSRAKRDSQIGELEALAREVRDRVMPRKRPLVVEFTGLPKAGKTTAVGILSLFLRRNGIATRVITEKASVCPLRDKHSPLFNIWTGCTSLSDQLEALDSGDAQVVIVDRGVYDTMVWMLLMKELRRVTQDEFDAFERFFLLQMWTRCIDVVVNLTASPRIALNREFKNHLTKKPGRIMNMDFLRRYEAAATVACNRYQEYFPSILSVSTKGRLPADVASEIGWSVLEGLRDLYDENLLLVDAAAGWEVGDAAADLDTRQARARLEALSQHHSVARRSEAEESTVHVQLIACGCLRHGDEVLIFKKYEQDIRNRLHGRSYAWVGGHVRYDDYGQSGSIVDAAKTCLSREIKEELNLNLNGETTFLGIVFDRSHPKSLLHLGVVFTIEIDDPDVFKALKSEEFAEFTGPRMVSSSAFLTPESLAPLLPDMEMWSVQILATLLGVDIPVGGEHSITQLFLV